MMSSFNALQVHLFGASLGGFLAQKFAESTQRSPRVASMVLCNSFYDTSIFQQTNSAPTYVICSQIFSFYVTCALIAELTLSSVCPFSQSLSLVSVVATLFLVTLGHT